MSDDPDDWDEEEDYDPTPKFQWQVTTPPEVYETGIEDEEWLP